MHLKSRSLLPALTTAAALALAGCGSLGAANAGAGGSAPPSASAAAPPSASSQAASACTTKACIAADAQKALPGLVAQDESVVTKARCKASSVKHSTAGGTWTVTCTATYSDGAVAQGLATLIPAQGKVAWEPTDVISYGNGS